MTATTRTIALEMPFAAISHCEHDSEWVCCLNCDHPLGLSQPESQEPERLIGTCPGCGRWYLLDWHPRSREGVMLLLPDHRMMLHSFPAR
jgi:DNA-binding transcriptional LysR family regulator